MKPMMIFRSPPARGRGLKQGTAISSSKDLTRKQGDDLIEHFRFMGFGKHKQKWTCTLCMPKHREIRPIQKETIYPASLAQLGVICELRKAVKWKSADGYSRWLFKYLGLTEVRWSPEATAVIVALKGVLRSQKQCCDCPHKFQIHGDENDGTKT